MQTLYSTLLFVVLLAVLPLSAEAGKKSKNHTPDCQNYLDDIPAYEEPYDVDPEYYEDYGGYSNTDEIDPHRGEPGPDEIWEPGDGGSARDPGGF